MYTVATPILTYVKRYQHRIYTHRDGHMPAGVCFDLRVVYTVVPPDRLEIYSISTGEQKRVFFRFPEPERLV